MVKKTSNKKYTQSQKEKYMCAKHKKFFTEELIILLRLAQKSTKFG